MKRPERLLFLPLVLVSLLLLVSGMVTIALIFAAVTGLFALDFQRRTGHDRDDAGRRGDFESRRDGEESRQGNIAADYRLLGLEPGANREEVRRVYRHLASHFHPDTSAPLTHEQRRTAEEAFLRIRSAYDRILESFEP